MAHDIPVGAVARQFLANQLGLALDQLQDPHLLDLDTMERTTAAINLRYGRRFEMVCRSITVGAFVKIYERQLADYVP